MKIALVVSEFNGEVTALMRERARRQADALGVEVSRVLEVPGVFDMPLAAQKLLARPDVDGVALIGAVVKGETLHDEVIAAAAAQAAANLALQFCKPVTLGVTGPGMTLAQAFERVDRAATAVEALVRLLRALERES